MDLVNTVRRKIQRSKCLQISLFLGATVVIYMYYNIGSYPKVTAMRDNSLKYQKNENNLDHQNKHEIHNELHRTQDNNDNGFVKKDDQISEVNNFHQNNGLEHTGIDVIIIFSKADNNPNLQQKFRTTVFSLFKFASIPIRLYILGDEKSENIGRNIIKGVTQPHKYQLRHLDIDSLAKQVHGIVSEMQKYFSYKPGAYYSDSLFFLSLVSHRVLKDMHRIILLDCDLKFNADILDLYRQFDSFHDNNIMGIARDAQPVYRHNWHMYRNKHKETRVGGPPPDGLTGFNSGVLLLDLDRMRKSSVYNNLLSTEAVKNLTEKYIFKGHLGDQDFYSLISLDHEDLFHVLPCNWNRQLCTWWRDHGAYVDVFDEYFTCEGHINIYHGNCNTPIPTLDWEKD